MERFTLAIRKAIEQENWFAALFIGLAMPDICGALEAPGAKPGERYRKWFDGYLKKKYHHENYFEAQYANDPVGTKERMRDPVFREYYEKQKLKPLESSLNFTAKDCYAFRNSCLHSGMSKDKKRAFVLIPPPQSGGRVHRNNIEGVLQLQIDILCEDICLAVEEWCLDNADNDQVQKRISELIEIKFDHFRAVRIGK
ncbi:hypothetical protein ACFO72_000806 [Enterobacter roggenkampii]|uniref:hypothetical protein n=1 Tax=Enterobacter roggenkampii TaxID=1812935 RepID=UPI00277C120C|nr:hypothetical protein [Enterobacter roggenkampii]